MAALNARDELRIQFGLIFEAIGEPSLKLHGLFGRQLPHLSFDGFELAHGDSVPFAARDVKAQATTSHGQAACCLRWASVLPVPKTAADRSTDAAACIGCGACVAVCKNASAMLFVAAKVSHLSLLPQGKAEKDHRVLNMVRQMDKEGFGNCTVTGSCEAVCPKEISLSFIAKMNRDYGLATLQGA